MSVHLSGVESLSNRYLTALSKWPLPVLAAVRIALRRLEEDAADDVDELRDFRGEVARSAGRERS